MGLSSVAVLTFFVMTAFAAPSGWSIETIVGKGGLENPTGVTVDVSGLIYIADRYNHRIVRYNPIISGNSSVIAGSQGIIGFADGTASVSLFNEPFGLTVSTTGVVFVADLLNHAVRRISCIISTCTTSTLAGSGSVGFVDAAGTDAKFSSPKGLALDSTEANLYVADSENNRIRKVDISSALVSTFAGNGVPTYLEGTGTSAQFNQPIGLTFVNSDLYVADTGNNRIRKITSAGVTSLYVGSGTFQSSDGTGSAARLAMPTGIAYSSSTNLLYVSEPSSSRIKTITLSSSSGTIKAFVGSDSGAAGNREGYMSLAQVNLPQHLAVSSSGYIYVADAGNNRILSIAPLPSVSTHAGTGASGSTNGASTSARFNNSGGVFVDDNQVVWVADTGNHAIRKISNRNVVETVAGLPGTSGYLDATGTNARFNRPTSIVMDGSANLFVCDQSNNRIRRISPDYVVTTFAGPSYTEAGTTGSFSSPTSVALGVSDLYVTNTGEHKILKISAAGVVSTHCGTGLRGVPTGTTSTSCTNTALTHPAGIGYASGSLYFTSPTIHRLFKIDSSRRVVWFAGLASSGHADGAASAAMFNTPVGLAVAKTNPALIFVVDAGNQRIRQLTLSGVTSTIAGSGSAGYKDGLSADFRFNSSSQNGIMTMPSNPSVGVDGRIYIPDNQNSVIRQVSNVDALYGGYTEGGASTACFSRPQGLAVVNQAGSDVVYISDSFNHRLRKFANGATSLLAGNGISNYFQVNNQPTEQRFTQPWGMSLHPKTGALFVSEYGSRIVRTVDNSTGIATRLIGNTVSGADVGTPGDPTTASFKTPTQVAWDTDTNTAYVVDSTANAIRVVAFTPNSTVDFLVGDPTSDAAGYVDGVGTTARLRGPQGIAFCSVAGIKWLLVADTLNKVVRSVALPSANVTTLGGTSFVFPVAVVCDAFGNGFVADSQSHQIRRVTPSGVVTTVIGFGSTAFNADGHSSSSTTGILAPAALFWQSDSDRSKLWVVGRSQIRRMTLVCQAATAIASGSITYSNANLYHPVTATYTCDPGFQLSGLATRECDTDGSWIGADPVCNSMTGGGSTSFPSSTSSVPSSTSSDPSSSSSSPVSSSTASLPSSTVGSSSSGSVSPSSSSTAPAASSSAGSSPSSSSSSSSSGSTGPSISPPSSVSIDLAAAGAYVNPASLTNTFFVGIALTNTSCVVAPTGASVQFSISPALPPGLMFDPTTGALSGLSTSTSASTTYTITAANAGGSTTVNISFAVVEIKLTGYLQFNGLLYESLPLSPPLQLQGTQLNVLQNFRSEPALPVGLVLNTQTGQITGIPLRALPRANYTISAEIPTQNKDVVKLVLALEVIGLTDPVHPAKTTGDPHIVGFKGQKFDIQGLDQHVYNMYSDSDAQLSFMLGRNPMVEEDGNTAIIGVSFRFGKRGVVVFTAKDNQVTVSPRPLVHRNEHGWTIRMGECTEIRESKDGLEVIFNQYHLKVNRRAYFIDGRDQQHFYFLNIDFSAFPTHSPSDVDGILGQTFRLPEAVTPLGKNGEGVLEHPLSEYEVHGGVSSLNTKHRRYKKFAGLDCTSTEFQQKMESALSMYSSSKVARKHKSRH